MTMYIHANRKYMDMLAKIKNIPKTEAVIIIIHLVIKSPVVWLSVSVTEATVDVGFSLIPTLCNESM